MIGQNVRGNQKRKFGHGPDIISIPLTKKALRQRDRHLSIFREMNDLLSSSLEIKEVLHRVLDRVLDEFQLDAGRIYLMDENNEHLTLAVHSRIDAAGLETIDIYEGFSGKAARTRSFLAQYVAALEDQNRAALLQSKGINIVVCVPMITKNGVVGVINLATSGQLQLDHKEIDIFHVLGSQIGTAIENLRLNRELGEKIQQLRERKETIKFFAYSIAHDLKSPAIGIHGFSRHLKDKYATQLDERGKEYCEQIQRLAEHIVNMLEDINAYITAKEVQPRFEVVKLKEVIGSIKSEFEDRLKSGAIKLLPHNIETEVVADKRALIRALRNLVDNAIKYGGPSMNEIKIAYSESREFHILSVTDNGVGIPREDAEGLFNVFQRTRTSQGMPGSGLGLAVVKEVAEKHGGRAWVESEPDKGTAIYMAIKRDLVSGGEYDEPL